MTYVSVLNLRLSVSSLIARTSSRSSCDRQLMGSRPELSKKQSDDVSVRAEIRVHFTTYIVAHLRKKYIDFV